MRPLTAAHEKIWYSLPSFNGSPSLIQPCEVLDCSALMSTASLRAFTLPAFANCVSSCGLGAAARSGALPAATRVLRIASSSRVDSYCTLIPVESSKGLSTAMNDACSCPDQTATTFTDPALDAPPEPHPTATRITPSNGTRVRTQVTALIGLTPTFG